MARQRGRAGQLLPLLPAWTTDEEAVGAARDAALAHRAHVPRSQGRTRTRSLRRPAVSWLAPSRLGRSVLLRVRHCRTCAAFPPLGQKAVGSPRAVARGLSATSPIASPPC